MTAAGTPAPEAPGGRNERLETWKAGGRSRTHEVVGGWHVLRERGVLLARNRDLSLALDTAERRP